MSDKAFSIDLNQKYTRMCDLDIKGDKIEITALGYEDAVPFYYLSENEKIIQNQALLISQMYNKLKIKKKSVNVIIPDEYTFSQIVEMPKLKEKELLAAIRYQADEFIPMPIDETNLDLEILRDDPKTKKLLLLIVASPKKLINQIARTMELAHLVPESLETELSAVGRIFMEVVKSQGKSSIIINFGYSSTSIYLLDGQSSLIVLARSFRIGYELFVKDLKVNLNWDDKKIVEFLKNIAFNQNGVMDMQSVIGPIMNELYRELEKFIIIARDRYGSTIEKLYLFNYNSQVAGLDTNISTHMTLPIESVNLNTKLVQNPISQSFSSEISSFISVISGNLR